MRRTSGLLVGFLALLASLCPSTAFAGAEDEAIDALNDIRRSQGLPALRASDSLAGSADRWARHMLRSDFFGHGARIAVAGQFRSAGETLAMHTGPGAQPRRTVGRWMASPPHRAILLSSRFRRVGMGMERGGLGGTQATVWVAHVGSR